MAQVNLGHVVGPGVPTGGSANQVLVKNGSTNFDASWKTADQIPAIANVQDGLAIVANGNTHAAIASGQFVYVKNHGSLAEGLYRATEAIGTNATLSTSNLTADSAGGLNALKADVDTLNSNKANKIQTMIVEGTTDSDGDISINLSTISYALVSCSPDRNTTGYYTSWYAIIPYGANNADRYSAKCINDNVQKLASTAVRFRVNYIQK